MKKFCKNRYRLELRWDSVEYHNDSTARLVGCRFEGPVLKNAQRIQAPDFIDLDLTPQHLIVLNSYYIVRLDWDAVSYGADGSVALEGARLSNDFLNKLHRLEDHDYVVINTEKHEEKTHAYNLVYEAMVARYDSKPHEYTR